MPLLRPRLNWLLIAIPVAGILRFWLPESPALFIASAVGIIPLAGLLGRATDSLARRAGAGVGGLLNATFGNAAEFIIGLMALAKGLPDLVKASLTGSILGNLLLVLGVSMLSGGIRHSKQEFNRTAARTAGATMSIAALALLIPTIFHSASDSRPLGWSAAVEQQLSLAIAIVLLAAYGATLVFSLVTHAALFSGGETEAPPESSPRSAILVLASSSVLIAVLSEFLLGSLTGAIKHMGFTETFTGVVVVAIIGNAAEHSTAVTAALRNRMDLSLGIAFGSSTQVALFVAPALVLCSYAFGNPMSLEFSIPEAASIAGAVWIAQQIAGDGESNWLEGVQLLAVYLIMALLFFFLPPLAA